MRVKHLIEELSKCDPEMEVQTEGCDCYGDTVSVKVLEYGPLAEEPGKKVVLIERNECYDEVYIDNGDPTPRPLPAR